MNRIVYMVLRHLPIVPYWFWKIDHMGKRPDQYPEQERYDYLRNIIKTINQNGRVTVRGYGEEQLPKENGFILFPNHQGFFDMLAIIDTCPKPLGVIIKKEAANWILVKQVLRLLGGIPMDRSDIRAAMEVIKEMAKETTDMVIKSVDAFVNKDLELARWVINRDDVVDDLFDSFRKELIQKINENVKNGEMATDMLMVAKYFERIGDHATNIAEWVIYSITGKHEDE